jgi:hypothetical protein
VSAKDLGVDAATFVWLISGPILANALVTTAAGRLGDLHGHRRLYLWGMVASAVFAALSVVAWDGPSLVAFRVLGAIAGAAAGPSSMAIINLSVEPAKRSRALGYWSLVGGAFRRRADLGRCRRARLACCDPGAAGGDRRRDRGGCCLNAASGHGELRCRRQPGAAAAVVAVLVAASAGLARWHRRASGRRGGGRGLGSSDVSHR